MPRVGRIDYPGAIHHVMVRGLERRKLFSGESEYQEFKTRLGDVVQEAGAICYAWCLMPNHVHLVLRTGKKPLYGMMQRLLTGYGRFFNNKRHRKGYVFEGRYKSILCQEEPYFLMLVRYVHRNPLKAGLVRSLGELGKYSWTGHRALVGKETLDWQGTKEVLDRFGKGLNRQRKAYLEYMGVDETQDLRLDGKDLVRALDGIWDESVVSRRRSGHEEILGDEEFVEKALEHAEDVENRRKKLADQGWTLGRVLERASGVWGLKPGQVRGASKEPQKSQARALACKWMVEDMGRTTIEVGRFMRIGQPAVVGCVKRGRKLETSIGVRLGIRGRRSSRK